MFKDYPITGVQTKWFGNGEPLIIFKGEDIV